MGVELELSKSKRGISNMSARYSTGITLASFDVGTNNCAVFVVEDSGRVLLFDLWSVGFSPSTIVPKLDEYLSVWKRCHAFLVENQPSINTRAVKIQLCIETYFTTIFGPFKLVFSVSPQLKTFGNKFSTKSQRKRYTVDLAKKILTEEWPEHDTIFVGAKKKDDLADALCQWVAFCKKIGAINK